MDTIEDSIMPMYPRPTAPLSSKDAEYRRLRQEFEHLRDIDDRKIDKRLREVRLKRLYREIDEIREQSSSIDVLRQAKRLRLQELSPTASVRHPSVDRRSDSRTRHRERLFQAREIGKEYSRINASLLAMARTAPKAFAAQPPITDKELAERKRLADRTAYGNDISAWNRELGTLRVNWMMHIKKKRQALDAETEKANRERPTQLQKRLQYGNERSDFNKAQMEQRAAKKVADDLAARAAALVPQARREAQVEVEPVQFIDMPPINSLATPTPTPTGTDTHTGDTLPNTEADGDAGAGERPPSVGHDRAQHRWRKLSLLVCNRSNRKMRSQLDGGERESEGEPNGDLRYIPSNLQLSGTGANDDWGERANMMVEGNAYPLGRMEDDLDGEEEGETLIHLENLHLNDGVLMADSNLLPPPPPEWTEASNAAAAPPPDMTSSTPLLTKVSRLAKTFEPTLRQVAAKEAKTFSFQKLRNVFEHQMQE